jgi:hypothetical protein
MRILIGCTLTLLLGLSIADAASMLGRAGGGNPPAPPSYVPLCGGSNPTCTYAFSTERKMVSGATNAITVQRSVDSTTQNIGFIASGANAGLVNTATVDSFCNASVGGVISRNCYLEGVIDQTGNGCLIFNSTASAMPNYLVDPGHQGLPRFQKVFQGGATQLNFLLDNNGGSTATLTNPCALLTGLNQSLFYAGNSSYVALDSGQAGLQENTPSAIKGTMFSAITMGIQTSFGRCSTQPTLPCGGMDSEGQGPQYNYTRTSNDDYIDIAAAPVTGASPWNIWINNVLDFPNDTISGQIALVTQERMSWGASGDHSDMGPNISRSETFYNVTLTGAQELALYNNETAFAGALTLGYRGPGDVVGGENSYSPGVTGGNVQQLMWLSQCFSLRKCYASYEGPSLNVCQGSGACEDIGWVNNIIDTATMSAYCGPVSGLNNCAVQKWYNEAFSQTFNINGVNASIDATAVSSAHRPIILWSGCGTTAITVCVQTTSANYFSSLGSAISVDSGYSMSAVAQRTGGVTSLSAILSSAATATTFIGFAASANTCAGSANTGGGGTASTVACNDNAVHAIAVDAQTSPSASIIIYADGTAGSTSTATPAYSATGSGLGATSSGVDPCACQLSEVMIFADRSNSSFSTGLGPTGVANLRANQRAVFGF